MINFELERKGYNRKQVKSYLQKVQEQYRAMHEENQSLMQFTKQLEEENDQLRKENTALKEDHRRFAMSSQEKTALIAEATRQAELTAKRILKEAFAPAQRKLPTPAIPVDATASASPSSSTYQRSQQLRQPITAAPLSSTAQRSESQQKKEDLDNILTELHLDGSAGKAGDR